MMFVLEGLFVGTGGAIVGAIAGVVLSLNITPIAFFLARIMGVDLLNSQFVVGSKVPVELEPWSVLWIAVSALVLTGLSTIYPAWTASRLDPIDAMRRE